MRTTLITMLPIALGLGIAGCKPRTPTFHRDIEPILARHCRDCHRADGVAPVPLLDSYASVRRYAQPMRLAVQTRMMPPWGADNTGLCGAWQHPRWLSTEEVTTVASWQQAGAPEGDPASRPPSPTPLPVPSAFRADVEMSLGGRYQPRLGSAGNRCFLVDPQLPTDRLLTAIRVGAPGSEPSEDTRAVAQVALFAFDSDAAVAAARALDAADPELGYACYGDPRTADARLVASWTWPAPVRRLPDRTGVRVPGTRPLVVQIHYNIMQTGDSFAADTHVALELADVGAAVAEARIIPIRASAPELPPGLRYTTVESRTPVIQAQRLVGIVPRMHIRGDTMQLHVERRGAATCAATFDHWNPFNEQLFVLSTPLSLEPGDALHLQCAYGTLGRTKPVRFGSAIDDEECIAYLFVIDG